MFSGGFMFRFAPPSWMAALAVLAAPASFAQNPALPSGPAGAVALEYRSTLDNYQRFTDEKVRSWKESNDTVGRIGGWREYARQSREPAAPSPAGTKPAGPTTPASPAAPAAAPEGGRTTPHSGHGQQR